MNKPIVLFFIIPFIAALMGCSTLEVAADRAQSLAADYCALPAERRIVYRSLVNTPIRETAVVVMKCASDHDFEEFRATYVPTGDLRNTLINIMVDSGKDTLVLPDGTQIKLVVQPPE